MIVNTRSAACVFVAIAISAGQQENELRKKYEDNNTGLTINFPDGWNLDNDSPVFTILSFPAEKQPRQLLVPLDGGRIFVMRAPEDVATVEDWLRRDRIWNNAGTRVSRTKVQIRRYGDISATVVQSEPAAIPEGRSTSYIFKLGGTLYKVGLFYRGQKRADYFTSVLKAMIKNLEPEKLRP